MGERPENLEPAGEDPEATLVTPRFDAAAARRAHPVVPLAAAPAHVSYVSAPAPRRRFRRRSWMPALFAVALLAVAAVGGAVATKYMQDSRARRTPEQAQTAPVQTAEAPPQPSTPPAEEALREDASAATPTPRRARARRERAAPAPMRYEAQGYRDEDGELREIREEVRREREKEMRKATRRARKNEPRLVDVLTRP